MARPARLIGAVAVAVAIGVIGGVGISTASAHTGGGSSPSQPPSPPHPTPTPTPTPTNWDPQWPYTQPSQPSGPCHITVPGQIGHPGGSFGFGGYDFTPSAKVGLYLGNTLLGYITIKSDGTFSTTITFPKGASGNQQLCAKSGNTILAYVELTFE